jgi:hypothetical protein
LLVKRFGLQGLREGQVSEHGPYGNPKLVAPERIVERLA